MARILQVCNSDFYLAGFLLPLFRQLVEEGHCVECVCEGTDLPASVSELGIAIHPFEYPRRASPAAFWGKIGEMRRLMRAGSYDCVVTHNRGASMVGRVAAWLERVPMKVYTAHGFYFHDDQSFWTKEVTIWIELLLGQVTDYTLSQSRADVDFAIRRGIARRDRIEYIGNGIDTKRFTPGKARRELEQELGFESGPFRICSIGRLVRGKGFGDLLEAFAQFHASVPRSELLIIGGNIGQDIEPFQQQFLQRVAELQLSRVVRVTGITSRVEDYLGICDLFVLPSYREGVPRALLEAMSMGLPAVATEIRGCTEIIEDGQNGFLFPPKDIGRLGSLLTSLYQSPALRKQIGQNGRETSIGDYDESRYVAVQVAAINRLVRPEAAV